jgi:hypothetical protein
MKRIFCLAVAAVLGSAHFGRCADAPQPIKAMLDIRPTIRILYPNEEHFFVVMENVSSKPVYLQTVNGEMDWVSFEITDERGEKFVIHTTPRIRTKTTLSDILVDPGEATVLEVYFMRQQDWQPFPLPEFPRSRKLRIRAVCDIPSSFRHHESWSGQLASHWYEVTIENHDNPPGEPKESRAIGLAIWTGAAYGMLNAAADGQEGNLYLKSLSFAANGHEWPIPAKALQGIQRPILGAHGIVALAQTNENQRVLFDIAIELAKPPSFVGAWKRHRVHFLFEDAKFQKRYTTVEEEKMLNEWKP